MYSFWKKSSAVSVVLGIFAAQCSLLSVEAAKSNSISTPDFSYLGAAGSFTENQTQEIAKKIYRGLAAHDSVIEIGGSQTYIDASNYEDAMDITRSVLSSWDVGILTARSSIGYYFPSGGKMQILPVYLENSTDYTAAYQELTAKLDEIVSGMEDNWSDTEKALYLHEYISLHYNYDTECKNYTQSEDILAAHTAYGMLTKGMAVCDGYSSLYSMLLHKVGIDSELVECESMAHAWNLVCLDGNWYHVDTTWDDDMYKAHAGLVSHENFLKTSAEMSLTNHTTDNSEDDWKLASGRLIKNMPSDDFYTDGFWNDCNTLIQPYQGKWFAIHSSSSNDNTTAWFDLCDYDAASGTAEITHINSLDAKWARWYVFENENRYYTDTYVTPAIAGNIIYYTTPTAIFALKENNQVEWLLDLTAEQQQQGYIYGMYLEGTTLHYYVSTACNQEFYEYIVEIPDYQEETITTTTSTTPETTTTTTTSTTPETTTTTTTSTTPETTTTTTTSTTPETTTTTTTSTTPETTTTTTTSTTPETTTTTTTSTTPETTATTTTSTTPETTTTTTTETELIETEPSVIIGDIDGDNQLSVEDAILLEKYLHGEESLTEEKFFFADITNDDVVNIFDFIVLKKMLLNA